uniref:Uncharacterized protein n=1 Tax=uncultured prokaryote TaxID=198431 RepID=A0A0H5Q0P3_9ZZZZ|nr:hypothetical protein [uncultured prokaryote]
MTQRKPTVAYGNGRLVNMLKHENCLELRSRYIRSGVVQQVVALLYREGEAFILLGTVTDEDGSHAEAWDAEAFLIEGEAARAAMHFAMFQTRTGEGR